MSSAAELGSKAIAFVEQLGTIDDVAELTAALRRAVEPLGLTAISSAMVSGPLTAPTRRFHFLDWPQDWLDIYKKEQFFDVDPIPRWALSSGRAASFTEVARLMPSRDPGQRVVEAARTHHFGEGLLVPVRLPNGSVGIVSLGGDRDGFGGYERAFLEIVAGVTLLRASALEGRDRAVPLNAGLTRRELDCIDLLVRGLQDREIAARLRISEPTVRFHLDSARRKTAATSRTHLAALAIWLGLSRL